MVVQKSYAKVSPNQQKKWAADLVPQLFTLYYSIKSSAKCGDMKKDEGKSGIATFVEVWAKIRVNQEAGGRVRK
jgi:hypothetical protein